MTKIKAKILEGTKSKGPIFIENKIIFKPTSPILSYTARNYIALKS